ncbi:MAG: hypothetical protein B6D64_15090 [Bacteroidetes bacterium 4484_276]|nr:MAG: hypothetical protein B6D64_15090 [Bacteroidetes bacterium 4484_276]
MTMDKILLQLLQRSYDEELSPAEQEILEKALGNDSGLREEKKKLDAIRRVFSDKQHTFGTGFFRLNLSWGLKPCKQNIYQSFCCLNIKELDIIR